ncbi:MAG: von Willebrand factor type A domain-containing protein [Planctomycetota bacterium]
MTNNNFKPDDPNLTAYALGELEPGSDVYEQVKARLDQDADAAAFVEQTRALGDQLSASYQTDETNASGLLDHQQKELAAMIDQQDNQATEPITPPKPFWRTRPALLAAGLALAAGAAFTTITLMDRLEDVDIVTPPERADLASGIAEVSEQLTVSIPVEYVEMPLGEVFASLSRQISVEIDTDWDALAKRGIEAKTPVTLKADGVVPAGRVLSAVLQAAGSQSQHPDPAQWTMNDQGVTVAPQSALVQARLEATAALLETNRLSRSPVDERLLSADRAEVWESDLWNRMMEQREEAALAVLAEADAALTASEIAADAENYGRAADKAMYAYHLIRGNSTLIQSDQFDEPAKRFKKINEKIAAHHAKNRPDPNNASLDDETNDSKKDTNKFQELTESERTIELLSERVERLSIIPELPLNAPVIVSDGFAPVEAFGLGSNSKSANGKADFKTAYAGSQVAWKKQSNLTGLYLSGGQQQGQQGQSITIDRASAGLAAGRELKESYFFSLDPAAPAEPVPSPAASSPPVRLAQAEKAEREMLRRRIAVEDLRRVEALAKTPSQFDRRRVDNEGKPITRRAMLQTELDELVKDKPLPQLDEQTQARYNTIALSLEDAKEIEGLELQRLRKVQELEELGEEFWERCQPALEFDPELSRDAFAVVNDNPFYDPAEPGRTLSTFSVDVDTAAYSIARRQLMERNQLPVPGAVRIEEMINYFDYNYDAPVVDPGALQDGVVTQASLEAFEKQQEGFAPFATHLQLTDCPWTVGNQLVRIGVKGMEVAQDNRPSAHLTFLLDVSGSMNRPNKLGLVKDSLKLLLDKLNEDDKVSIVVYAGASGLVLENAAATNRAQIEGALDKLRAGGSTAGAAGIQLAYEIAHKHYIDGGVNRVILCTDGDFNVGTSGTDALVELIKEKANPTADADGKRRGVYLSVFGYGMGNLNDQMMEPLSNAGNGMYAYIDTLKEATKVMYDQAGSNMVTIAKDVKVQVQFDPDQVMAYRLIGYENRVLANEDFDNDKVDAGDIGAGHSVTALYEIVPFPEDGGLGNEGFFEVMHRLDELEEAVSLNQTLMQTAQLTPKQSMKLAASTRMLEQEIQLAGALANKLEQEKKAAERPANAAPVADADAGADANAAPPAEVEPLEDGAMMAVKLRYKPVDAPAEDGTSRLIETRVFADDIVDFAVADESTRFAAAVASFAMQLRTSPHAGDADLAWVLDTVKSSSTHDPSQLKFELQGLIKRAKELIPEKVIEEVPAAGGV